MSLHFDSVMESGDREFRLRAALLVYYGTAGALVTAHDVHSEPGAWQPKLLGGAPLTRELADRLVRGIQGLAPTRTILPANVLMWDGGRLAWWVPSRRRRIWFAKRGAAPELQRISRQEVLHPPVLFVADPGRLFMYALAESARPEAGTPLFQAPYFNIYADGSVCAGGVRFPETVVPESMPEWESAWFESEGTHPAAPRLTLYPGGHNALWLRLLTAIDFPADSLVPLPLTALDAVNRQAEPMVGPQAQEEIVPALEEVAA